MYDIGFVLCTCCNKKEVSVVMNTSEKVSKESVEKSLEKKCSFCGAREGKPHPIRGFKVELNYPYGDEEGGLACQVCRIHFRKKETGGAIYSRSNPIIIYAMIVVMVIFLAILGISLR